MTKIEFEVTDDEVVELIALDTLMDIHFPKRVKTARNKLMNAVRERIREMEMDEFNKAIDRYKNKLKK
jgi:hypothetical protein